MNTPEQILDCLKQHAARGMEKHEDFQTATHALDTITIYMKIARTAAANPSDPVCQEQFAEALARIGGLVLKTYANLDVELVPVKVRAEEPATDAPATPA